MGAALVRAPRSSREPQLCESGRRQIATAARRTGATTHSSSGRDRGHLTMRLSDAGLHQRQTKALYPNHRLPPLLTEDAPRDRSNRLLEACAAVQSLLIWLEKRFISSGVSIFETNQNATMSAGANTRVPTTNCRSRRRQKITQTHCVGCRSSVGNRVLHQKKSQQAGSTAALISV
jgi:hypothetical protein